MVPPPAPPRIAGTRRCAAGEPPLAGVGVYALSNVPCPKPRRCLPGSLEPSTPPLRRHGGGGGSFRSLFRHTQARTQAGQHSPPRCCAGWPVLPPNDTNKFVHSFALSTISQLAGATCSRTSHCETFLGSARCAHWPSSNRQVDGHVSPLAHGDIEDQTLVLLEFGYS